VNGTDEIVSTDDDTLEILNRDRDMARLRLLAVHDQIERLEAEREDLVGKIAKLDYRIEELTSEPLASRNEARRMLGHAREALDEARA
jgi:predicted  nucleic acid-binding Zn-ribbon protein